MASQFLQNSSSLFERAKLRSPGGVHSPVRAFKGVGGNPIFFKAASGAHLTSVEGGQYIDFCMSFGPLILGHRYPEIEEVVRETVGLAWTFGACEPYSLELAEFICSRVAHVEKVRFVSSGTEAVMSALRVARAATGRNHILKFDGCYHGHVDSLLVRSGSGLAGEASSDSAGLSENCVKDTIVAPLNDIEALREILKVRGSDIAAVIVEPLPANYGLLVQDEDYLREMALLVRQNGSLLIYDEVISGFRVAMGGMAEKLEIVPDLVTYGKIIGGGFPVGAYGGKAKYMELVAPEGPVYQAGTLSANPFGMRAGLKTLSILEELKVHSLLRKKAEMFSSELNGTFNSLGINLNVSCYESILWFHPVQASPVRSLSDISPSLKSEFASFFHRMLMQKIYFAPSGYEVGFLSLAHDDNILSQTIHAVKRAYS